tara:strand:+ start:949 stop:1446 length:498 start_codon:yes stop_codon:yes gene_type:complete
MDATNFKILETIIAVVLFVVLKIVVDKSINRTVAKNLLQKTRGKIVKKIVNTLLLVLLILFILIIWGLNQSDILLFVSSVLAVVGIAFFAQWSILSNITSGLIIFFGHSVKLDDVITVLDKDFEIEGRISDIGLFFVIIKTEAGDQITLPSNVFIQKMIRKKANI